MTDVVHNTDHLAEGLAKLTQMTKQPNVQGILSAFLREVQKAEDALYSVWYQYLFPNAVGDQLDQYGLMLAEGRKGRDDDAYRVGLLLRMRVLRSKGRINDIIDISRLASGAANLSFQEPGNLAVFQVTKEQIDPAAIAQLKTALKQGKTPGVRGLLKYTLSPPAKCFRFGTVHPTPVPTDVTPPYDWTTVNSSLPSNGADPDGGTAAQQFKDNTTNGKHEVWTPLSTLPVAGKPLRLSCYFKNDGLFQLRWVKLMLGDGTNPPTEEVWFDVFTGTIGTVNGTMEWKAEPFSLGSSWWHLTGFKRSGAADAASNTLRIASASADGVSSYAGTSQTVWFYNPKIYVGQSAYVGGRGMSSAHIDDLHFPEFSGWSADTGSSLTGGQADPGGTATAAKFSETAINDIHTAYSYYDNTGVNGTDTPLKGDSVFEFYAKYNGRQWLEMSLVYRWQIWFDLLNGEVGTKVIPGGGSGVIQSATMTDVGDGWWLCRVEHTGSNSAAYYSSFIRMHLASADNTTAAYMGDVSKGALLYKPKLFSRDSHMASGETI